MSFYDDYNRIIDAIEENIHEEVTAVYKKVALAMGMQSRDVASIYKFISGEKYSSYIKKRQIYRIAQEKMSDRAKPWDRFIEEYSIKDYSTFNRRFKVFVGITPEDFPQKYEGEIWEQTPEYISEKSTGSMEAEFLIDYVPPEEDPFIQCDYNGVCIEQNVSTIAENEEINSIVQEATGMLSPFFTSEEIKNYINSEVEKNEKAHNLLELYDSFQEIEELRAIYGLSVAEAIYIFMKNKGDINSIYDECERLDDEETYAECEEYSEEMYWEAAGEDYYDNCMTHSEAWDYYQGEDEMDYEDEEGFNNNSIRHMYY